MKTCTFSINYNGDCEILFSRIVNESKKVNANISGNSLAGKFNVSILGSSYKGHYSRNGTNIHINISQKPFYISCGTIKAVIMKYLVWRELTKFFF